MSSDETIQEQKDPFDLKKGTELHKLMEKRRDQQEKLSKGLGVLDENDSLVFRGFALIFTDEDETFETRATMTDQEFDEDDYE